MGDMKSFMLKTFAIAVLLNIVLCDFQEGLAERENVSKKRPQYNLDTRGPSCLACKTGVKVAAGKIESVLEDLCDELKIGSKLCDKLVGFVLGLVEDNTEKICELVGLCDKEERQGRGGGNELQRAVERQMPTDCEDPYMMYCADYTCEVCSNGHGCCAYYGGKRSYNLATRYQLCYDGQLQVPAIGDPTCKKEPIDMANRRYGDGVGWRGRHGDGV